MKITHKINTTTNTTSIIDLITQENNQSSRELAHQQPSINFRQTIRSSQFQQHRKAENKI